MRIIVSGFNGGVGFNSCVYRFGNDPYQFDSPFLFRYDPFPWPGDIISVLEREYKTLIDCGDANARVILFIGERNAKFPVIGGVVGEFCEFVALSSGVCAWLANELTVRGISCGMYCR